MYIIVLNRHVKHEKVVDATLWTNEIWKPQIFNSLQEVEKELSSMEENGIDISEAVVLAPMESI